jgi:hypothetical protein
MIVSLLSVIACCLLFRDLIFWAGDLRVAAAPKPRPCLFRGDRKGFFPSGFPVSQKILPGEPKPKGRASETQLKRARSRTAAVFRT